MHYLHPRSRQTGTLFTATLVVSFAVVALPHVLPCPVDRRQFADTIEMPDGTIRRRRRRQREEEGRDGDSSASEGDGEAGVAQRPKRECPVPKPGGIVGSMIGFKRVERAKEAEVVVKELEREKEGRAKREVEEETT
ncbi:hypothetical protein Tdes44962_MAKER03089 [Teratosphaeria destructans]|uniref:Alpha-1,3-mannosyltransferase n=1 Tax=Teratosphaeria destructans TaxID=418781 RepID=A0A9W7SQY0_9PEZI|nr:hypothetical protein Tdes44962_MAKER03089 [Teratosphaeria destructans]